jgi:hypothetical protein
MAVVANENEFIGERHALVTITGAGWPDKDAWATLSGGAQTAAVTRTYNGGSTTANIIPARVVIADIVVTRPFQPRRDAQLAAWLRTKVAKLVVPSIVKVYLDLDGFATIRKETFTGCLLTAVTAPNYDENSANGAFMSLTFTPSGVA